MLCSWIGRINMMKMSILSKDFPGSSADKESACHAGDPDLIPGSVSSPGKGIGNPLHYSWASLVAQAIKNLQCRRPG